MQKFKQISSYFKVINDLNHVLNTLSMIIVFKQIADLNHVLSKANGFFKLLSCYSTFLLMFLK